MSNTQTITPVHVKVALNGDFRRFLLNPPTYVNLESTVKTLFSITSAVSLKFQDDEKDWVHLTTDTELLYAIELAGSPLRVDVKILAEVSSTPEQQTESPEAFEGCRGRGGKKGRGCGGGRGGCMKADRLTKIETRVNAKIAELQEKLDSGKLTSERERAIRWKLARTQEKLAWVNARRAGLETANPETEEPEHPFHHPHHHDFHHHEHFAHHPEHFAHHHEHFGPHEERWGKRGGRGGCRGRRGGCMRGEEPGPWGKPKGCLKKRLSPEILENFQTSKAALKAAKESGDEAQIAACKEAFFAAKEAKWAAMAALRAECGEGFHGKPRGGMKRLSPEIKENFHQCKAAWKAAKESGDEEQIAACKEAFWAAKEAKWAALAALRAQDAGEEQETKTGSA